MIDAKELRVGNHVDVRIKDLIEHTRVRLCRITDDNEVCYTRSTDFGLLASYAYHLQPIPITAELLTEIGFKHGSNEREWHKYIGEAWIVIRLFHDRERMRITVCDDSADYGNAIIRYLHQAENFIYMTLGKELIEE